MEKVYGFTNENVRVFSNYFDFNDANVLTVLGSGDQYFQAILDGAKNVDVFDINYIAWLHFLLKFTAIRTLSYEEFIQMFIIDNLNNLAIYGKLRNFLPDEVKYFFDKLISLKRDFSSIKLRNVIFDNAKINNIPYFDSKTYYVLQSLLRNQPIPSFYNCDLLNIKSFTKESYDVALISNIYHYLSMNANQYLEFLNKNVKSSQILALYTWILNDEERDEFLENGFDVYLIPGVLHKDDYIISLSRKRS